jgi:photosystem II stability/assembly factor-like uncharacterized protein
VKPLLAAFALAASIGDASAADAVRIEALHSPVTVRLRGLSALSDTVAWASGREGTVLHTTDAGRTWRVTRVPGAEALDFRDVQAFGADEAVVMGAGPGDASRVYRTTDGGATWALVMQNSDPAGFFDCIDFDGEEGRLLGDPVGGRFQLYASRDRGATWTAETGPRAEKDEAAFAASGTCVERLHDATVVVTGGSRARVHFLPDGLSRTAGWRALDAPGLASNASTGLFSVASRGGEMIAVGGDYKAEATAAPAFGFIGATDAVTTIARSSSMDEHGVWFEPMANFEGRPSGYRSGIACSTIAGASNCIATGPSGTDVLPDTGNVAQRADGVVVPVASPAWTRLADAGYDSVDSAGRVFWFSGDGGRLGRLVLPPSD